MKQKFFKTLITVVMILIAATLILNNVFAAVSSTDTTSITVSNLEEGVTVKIYQLALVDWDEEKHGCSYTWANETISSYMATYGNGSYSTPENFSDNCTTTAEIEAFYVALMEAIGDGTLDLEASDSAVSEGESVTFDNLAMGTYLIEITGGTHIYSPLVVNLEPEKTTDSETGETEWNLNDAEVEAKRSDLNFTQEVTNTTTTINDTNNYTITASVPEYLSGSLANTYKISVDLGDTQELYGDIVIYVEGENGSEELSSDAYIITYTYDENDDTIIRGYEITFDYDKISKYANTDITITYSTLLSYDEGIVEGNTSTATLTYTNNPYTTAEDKTIEASATVYTYGAKLTKVKKSDTEATLSGAKFTVQDSNGDTMYFLKDSDGVYYLYYEVDDAVTELEVASNGTLCIYGIGLGDYSFTETVAPDGYNLATAAKTISLVDEIGDTANGSLENDGEETGTGIYEFLFTNSKFFSLPSTGSIGTTIFTICGAILMVAGVFVIVTRIKRNN